MTEPILRVNLESMYVIMKCDTVLPRSLGAKSHPQYNLCVGNRRYESQTTNYWITKNVA